jgi:hypothetical protein
MRRALVVAHPDDEALWFGGLLIAEPGDWTIICCSIPRADPVRAWKFFDACAVLGAKPKLIPYIEALPNDALENLDLVNVDDFDEIVTHNSVGEYGHRHHVQLNRFFALKCPAKMVTGCYGKSNGAKSIVLNEHQLGMKLAALRCYNHISPNDSEPKWKALLGRYGVQFDLGVETYDR